MSENTWNYLHVQSDLITRLPGSKAHGGSGDGRSKYVPKTKSKRQHIDEDEGSLDAPTSSAKKQRTRNLELPRKDGILSFNQLFILISLK